MVPTFTSISCLLLGEVDGIGPFLADLHALGAVFRQEIAAVFRINHVARGHCLGEGNIDAFPLGQVQIKRVRYFNGTVLRTLPAGIALCLVNVARLLLDGDLEVPHEALDVNYFRIGKKFDVGMIAHVSHFRGQNAGRTVQGGEGFIQLDHVSADARLLLYQVNLVPRISNVQVPPEFRQYLLQSPRLPGLHPLPFPQGAPKVRFCSPLPPAASEPSAWPSFDHREPRSSAPECLLFRGNKGSVRALLRGFER